MNEFHVGDLVKVILNHSLYFGKTGVVIKTNGDLYLVKIGNITQSYWDDWLELVYIEEKLTWQQDGF